jgi:molybdopterin-guanine dinucleotide biosynthesis adapter protein
MTVRLPPPLIGVAGWKNSGKTTLVVRLVEELTARGFKVATIKHAHHGFRIDAEDTDSARHRRAGARQVAIVSGRRWALTSEIKDKPEPSLDEMIAKLDPCDVVIVEGYKRAAIPKIEARRTAAASHVPLADTDPNVIAVAADHAVGSEQPPHYALDDSAGLADLICARLGLKKPR